MRKLNAQWRPTELVTRYRGYHLSVFLHRGKWWWDVSNHHLHHGPGYSKPWVAMRAAERFVDLTLTMVGPKRRHDKGGTIR
jgi:hypothetical protein